MRAISLWQPWATFIALGLKKYETRSWSPPKKFVGEPLLIHAAKRKMTEDEIDLINDLRVMYPNLVIPQALDENYPRGAIVARSLLIASCKTDDIENHIFISDLEADLGNYEPGRFAWQLAQVKKLEPIPFKGSQGFFDVPDEAVKEG